MRQTLRQMNSALGHDKAVQFLCISTATAKVPSHVIKCKSKKSATKVSARGIEQQPNIKPLIAQYQDHGPTRNTKFCTKNSKGERNKIVKIGNRLKKILHKIPPGIGMGEPPVAVAERPGKIPAKRGAIFSYAAKDLHLQRKTAIAITKNAKVEENWYTAANDYLAAKSSGTTPTWE